MHWGRHLATEWGGRLYAREHTGTRNLPLGGAGEGMAGGCGVRPPLLCMPPSLSCVVRYKMPPRPARGRNSTLASASHQPEPAVPLPSGVPLTNARSPHVAPP